MVAVVISGMGLACGPIIGRQDFIKLIYGEQSIFTPINRYHLCGGVSYAAQYPKVSFAQLPNPKFKKTINDKDMMALLVMMQAMEDAKLESDTLDASRLGLFVGTAHSIFGDLAPYLPLIQGSISVRDGAFCSESFGRDLTSQINPMVVMKSLLNNALSGGSRSFNAQGPNGNYMDLEVSGLLALIAGMRAIEDGRADVVIAGGVSSTLEPFTVDDGLSRGLYADTENGIVSDGSMSGPYTPSSEGGIPAEASCFLVLESEDHAIKRGAEIKGRLIAAKSNSDGSFKDSKQTSSGIKTIAEYLTCQADQQGLKISGAITGGNGHYKMDCVELNGLSAAYSQHPYELSISSIKGATGESNEASGPMSLIAGLHSLKTGEMPPTRHFFDHKQCRSGVRISASSQHIDSDSIMVLSRNQFGLCAGMLAVL